ncbi:MAG: 50S ribosomal protein L32 [Anaerolineae bacterium]|nr:50S ribosomal protein L32 [Anaerolineae bacterium]
MGAVPKRKISRGRRNRRRAHDAIKLPHLVVCPSCHEMTLPHRVCPHCGMYRGMKVIEVKES